MQTFDGVVVDDYYRKGLEINRALARDRYAASRELAAYATIADSDLKIEFTSSVPEVWPDSLKLSFYHPTVSNRDVTTALNHLGLGKYSAQSVNLGYGKWNVVAETEDWRLKGVVFHPTVNGFELEPAISNYVRR